MAKTGASEKYTLEELIEDVEMLIKFAVIRQLKQLVELVLSETITDQSCLKYWLFAKKNRIYSLESKCLAHIANKADYFFESSAMGDLTVEQMRCLLSDNSFRLQCDDRKIFEGVWKWVEGKCSETRSFSQIFLEVGDLFNYAEFEPGFILERIFFNEDLTANAELFVKIAKLIKQNYEIVYNRFFFYEPTQRLLGLTQNKMFIGLGEEMTIEQETDFGLNFSYTTFHNKWLKCGGQDSSSCEIFNTQKWEAFPSMISRRSGHRCAYLNNKIYVCGGYLNRTVEIFDLTKGEWDYGPQMLEDNWCFGLAGISGALYAIGGETHNVQILDARTQKWNVCCSFNEDMLRMGMTSCVAIGPYIYCFDSGNRCIYDTRSNKFIENIRLKDKHLCCNYWELDGYIYGFGYYEISADKYSLDLVQYNRDGKQRLKESYGLYNEVKTTGIVSLYK